MRAVIAATLLTIACSLPAAAQSYQSQCTNYRHGDYLCHSMRDSASSTTYSTWGVWAGRAGAKSETVHKVPPPPPYSISKKYIAPKVVAGK